MEWAKLSLPASEPRYTARVARLSIRATKTARYCHKPLATQRNRPNFQAGRSSGQRVGPEQPVALGLQTPATDQTKLVLGRRSVIRGTSRDRMPGKSLTYQQNWRTFIVDV